MMSFWRDRRGNVALIFGLAIVPLVVGVGAAVDYSRASSVRQHLQEIADAAALAGARENSDDVEHVKKVARAYFDSHLPPRFLAELTGFEVVFTDADVVRVDISGMVETTVAAVAGIDRLSVAVSSEVISGAKGSLEVALVLDNTGSMKGDKIATLKTVAKKIVKDVSIYDQVDARFALVPFTNYVNVGTTYRNASWIDVKSDEKSASWDGCVGSRDYPLNVRDESYGTRVPGVLGTSDEECPSEIQPLTDDAWTVSQAIDDMVADGYTYIPAGLVWGWRVLSRNEPFSQGASYDPENADPRKVIVLLTDGENTLQPAFPKHMRKGAATDVSESNQYVGEICENAKAENIEIFTVAFDVDDEEIKDILADCATDSAHYFEADDEGALAGAFEQMAASFLNLRIAR